MKLYPYSDYADYLEAQKTAIDVRPEKKCRVWVNRQNVAFVASRIRERMERPTAGLCHGCRLGSEQRWFSEEFPGCRVIGTDIDIRHTGPDTVEWDFNQPKLEWFDAMDFVYSNALDHAFTPSWTLAVWCNQLKADGLLAIEVTSESEDDASRIDPSRVEPEEIERIIPEGFRIVENAEAPYRYPFLKWGRILLIGR